MQIVKDWFRKNLNDPQVVVLTLLLLVGFIFIFLLGRILVPVLASLVIAYLLEGVVHQLCRRGIPRFPAVLLVYFAFLTVVVLVLFGLAPLLSSQFTQAIEELPNMISRVYEGLKQLPERYSFLDAENFTTRLETTRQGILDELQKGAGPIGQRIVAISLSSFRGLIVAFVYMILVPILVFFMLKDKTRILGWFTRFVPKERRLATEVWHDVDRQIANYVRGKFWEILIVGATTYATFALLGINYSILLALLVGLSVIVPYVGATVVTFPVAIVAYAQWGLGSDFLWLLGAYLVIQALDGNVLVPLIFSEAVHLHPIAIVMAVLVFGGIWGFWGAFFAIPLATLVQAVLKAWPRRPEKTSPPAAGSTTDSLT